MCIPWQPFSAHIKLICAANIVPIDYKGTSTENVWLNHAGNVNVTIKLCIY